MDLSHFNAIVADDHAVCRQIIAEILRSAGMRDVREALDGADAFQRVCERPPDLLFLDLEMPHDGLATLKRVRDSHHSRIRELPVVMVTAYTSRDRILALRDAGASEVMTKPITVGKLLGRARAALYFPRPFIDAATYRGPDRRRAMAEDHPGPWRRSNDQPGGDDVVEIDVA